MTASQTVILVTGANRGIGFDTAAALAGESPGHHVILASRSVDKLEEAMTSLHSRKLAGTLSVLELDVTSQPSITAAVQQVQEQFGKLDVLINNAGVHIRDGDLQAALRTTLDINATGSALVTYAFAPLLQKSNDPRIVYVSSGLGSLSFRADPNAPSDDRAIIALPYRMSKAAMNMLAVTAASDFRSWGCKVWAMCPGYVVTSLTGEEDRVNRIKRGALSAETSADTILRIVRGERDDAAGGFVHKKGTYEW